MNTFIHQNGLSLIEKDGQRLEAFLKPEFRFKFDELQFHESTKSYMLDGVETELSELEITELNDYIVAQDANPQTQTNFEAQMFLFDTDWYVIRRAETGAAIPTEILIKRKESREAITERGA